MPRKDGRDVVSAEERLRIDERRTIVAKQLRKGRTRYEILQYLKDKKPDLVVDISQITRDKQFALAELKASRIADIAVHRDMVSERLEALRAAHWDKAIGEDGATPDPEAAELVRKLIKDYRELWGTDVPVKTKVEVTDGEVERQKAIGETLAEMKTVHISEAAFQEFMAIYNQKIAADPNAEAIPAEYKEVE